MSMQSSTVTAGNEEEDLDQDKEVLTNVQITPSLSPVIVHSGTHVEMDHDDVVDNVIGIADHSNSHLLNRTDSVRQIKLQTITGFYRN